VKRVACRGGWSRVGAAIPEGERSRGVCERSGSPSLSVCKSVSESPLSCEHQAQRVCKAGSITGASVVDDSHGPSAFQVHRDIKKNRMHSISGFIKE
jgi:hypothetical protein